MYDSYVMLADLMAKQYEKERIAEADAYRLVTLAMLNRRARRAAIWARVKAGFVAAWQRVRAPRQPAVQGECAALAC